MGASKDYRQFGTTVNQTRRETDIESEFVALEVADWAIDELYRSIDVLFEYEPGFYIPVEVDGSSVEKFTDGQKMYSVRCKIRYAFADESQRR